MNKTTSPIYRLLPYILSALLLPASLTAQTDITALTELGCTHNKLTKLDVSALNKLTELRCESNKLTELDVSMLNKLETLNCRSNQLTALNLAGLPVTYFSGDSQAPKIAMTRNGTGGKYEALIALNSPSFTNKGLAYANGKLTASGTSIDTTSFSVETGLAGKKLEGRLYLTYGTGSANEAVARPPLKAVAEGGALLVSGLRPGDDLRVYNLHGTHIYNIAAVAAEQLRLDLPRGIYIIASGNRRLKAVAK
ncbi:MAG: hypothetical protein LBD21_09630 [Tannerellaceae bacterium]|jgi:hypothetical protein|nr:hypothetical protein [Tannerellaceae bacterium]